MRPLLLKRPLPVITALAVAASLVFVAASAAARSTIPLIGEPAFCNGEQVTPIDGVLHLDSSCILNLQITWPKGMRSAAVEYSSDGGSTWVRHMTRSGAPAYFAAVDAGLGSGIAFFPCDDLPSGIYLFRAHGFKALSEHGDLFSAPFPDRVACP